MNIRIHDIRMYGCGMKVTMLRTVKVLIVRTWNIDMTMIEWEDREA